MAELISTDKLQPCLLDRLTDLSPDREVEGPSERVVSVRRYREAVMRDVSALLSTPRPWLCENLSLYPEVEKSVLNYGMRDLSGSVTSSHDKYDLSREIRVTLSRFEPRLDPSSLYVETDLEGFEGAGNEIGFEVRGELWANPAPEELLIRTRIDLETGEYVLNDSRPA